MHCKAMFAALAIGAFTFATNVKSDAAEYSTAAAAIEPVEAATAGPVTTLQPAYANPRQYYSWRPWTFRRWSYGSGRFRPQWRDWSQRRTWRYGWHDGMPYRSAPRSWQQPWPSWRTRPYYGGYRGYAAAPWRSRGW